MIDVDMQAELLKRLDALSAKLGMGASKIWEFTVHQAYVEGCIDIVVLLCWYFLIGLPLALIGLHAYRQWKTSNETLSYRDPDWFIGMILFGGGGLTVFSVASSSYISNILTCFLNPQYWAFQHILSQLK